MIKKTKRYKFCSRLDEEIDLMFEDLLELYEVKFENTHVRLLEVFQKFKYLKSISLLVYPWIPLKIRQLIWFSSLASYSVHLNEYYI